MREFLYCTECMRVTRHRPGGICSICEFVTPAGAREAALPAIDVRQKRERRQAPVESSRAAALFGEMREAVAKS